MDRKTLRRLLLLALFIGLLVLFRKLLVLLVFFVAFQRPLAWAADAIASRTRIGRKPALGILALTVLGLLSGAAAFGVGRALRAFVAVRSTLPERIAAFRETPLYQSVQEHLGGADGIVERAQHYAGDAVHYLAAFGHILLYALIGFILAFVYLLEEEELLRFVRSVDPRSVAGTLMRWFGHVVEAMWVTLQFQAIVAACNAVFTLPVLLLVGVHHVTALTFMIFFSGLVPVVGNFVAGGVLTLLAYQAKGWLGVGLFVGLTFVLHKVESYYLNPRLAARHVRLPGFVLIISLLLWEHLLGFVGLFVSFPFLFVAGRIRGELRAEDAAAPPAAPQPVPAPVTATAIQERPKSSKHQKR